MGLLRVILKPLAVALLGYAIQKMLEPKKAKVQSMPSELKFGDSTRDEVDEASWESFPASDPPAIH